MVLKQLHLHQYNSPFTVRTSQLHSANIVSYPQWRARGARKQVGKCTAASLVLCVACSDGCTWEDQTQRCITEKLETGLSTHTNVPRSWGFQGQEINNIFSQDLEGIMCLKCVHCQLQGRASLRETLKLPLLVMDKGALFFRAVSILH